MPEQHARESAATVARGRGDTRLVSSAIFRRITCSSKKCDDMPPYGTPTPRAATIPGDMRAAPAQDTVRRSMAHEQDERPNSPPSQNFLEPHCTQSHEHGRTGDGRRRILATSPLAATPIALYWSRRRAMRVRHSLIRLDERPSTRALASHHYSSAFLARRLIRLFRCFISAQARMISMSLLLIEDVASARRKRAAASPLSRIGLGRRQDIRRRKASPRLSD